MSTLMLFSDFPHWALRDFTFFNQAEVNIYFSNRNERSDDKHGLKYKSEQRKYFL